MKRFNQGVSRLHQKCNQNLIDFKRRVNFLATHLLFIGVVILAWPLAGLSETLFPENYVQYLYPQEPEDTYKADPQDRFTYQARLAKGHDYLKKRSYGLAREEYRLATNKWNSRWQQSMDWEPLLRALKIRFTMRANSALAEAPEELDEILRGAIGTDGALPTTPLSIAFAQAPWPQIISFPGPAYYYLQNFTLPFARADLDLARGNFRHALVELFAVYHDNQFTEKTTNSLLEEYPAYGGNIPAAMLLPEKLANKNFRLKQGDQEVVLPLHPIEQKFVALKTATIYLRQGDLTYRQGAPDKAKPFYMQILRIYAKEWKSLVELGVSPDSSMNPRVVQLIFAADGRLRTIQAKLNYLGYANDYVPIWSYAALRDRSVYFISLAKSLERDALSFLTSAEQATENALLLDQAVALSERMVALETARVRHEEKSLDIAKMNGELAVQRYRHKVSESAQFATNHPIATGSTLFGSALGAVGDLLENPVGSLLLQSNSTFFSLGGVGSEFGGYVGSVFGWSTSGGSQRHEKEEQYLRMKHEEAELQKALEIADAEIERATISADIAKRSQAVARQQLAAAKENLTFAQNRTLNEEFWYQISNETRQMSHTYLDYGIALAWLTERAYAFEELDSVSFIKFDYLSRHDWLAADQLLLDLDSIEYRRLVSRKRKTIPITFRVSLRDNNPIAFDALRKTGEMNFTISQYELDRVFPGSYSARVEEVNVQVIALARSDGISGRLRKSSISWTRVPASEEALPDDKAEWITHTPLRYRRRVASTEDEVLLFPVAERRERSMVESARRVFEGTSPTGLWSLELPKQGNDFDYETLSDVVVTMQLNVYYDEDLRRAVVLEARKLAALNRLPLGNARGFSLRFHFPDQLYQLLNSPSPRTQVFIPILTTQTDFPANQHSHRLTDFWLGFLGDKQALPILAKLTALKLNPDKAFTFHGDRPVLASGEPLDALRWFPDASQAEKFEMIPLGNGVPTLMKTSKLDSLGASLFDLWVLRVDAVDNPQMRAADGVNLDPEKIRTIRDVVLSFSYHYTSPGLDGTPVQSWAHFREPGPNPKLMVVQDAKVTAVEWERSGGAAWQVVNGKLRHGPHAEEHNVTTPAAVSILSPLGFAASLQATLFDENRLRVTLSGESDNRCELRIQRSDTDLRSYTVQVVRTINGTTTELPTATIKAPGAALPVEVAAVYTGTSYRLTWSLAAQKIYDNEETDIQFIQKLKQLSVSTSGEAEIDNVYTADLSSLRY